MGQHSRLWNGTSLGDATEAPYDFDTELAEIFQALTGAESSPYKGGVIRGVTTFRGTATGKLTATGTGTPVAISTGLGLSYGAWYWNDAAISMVVDSPGSSSRDDVIVLRKDWALQTTTIIRIKNNTEGTSAIPALGAGVAVTPANVAIVGNTTYTRTYGTCWDVPLWQMRVTTGGLITLTDLRTWLPYHDDQSAEGGTRHAYSQVSGTPTFSPTVTPVTPGAAGVVGASGTIADGAHVHPLVADPYALRAVDQGFGAAYGDDAVLQWAVPAAGTYEFHGILITNGGAAPAVGASQFVFTGTTTSIQYGFVALDVATATTGMNYAGASDMGILGTDGSIHFHGVLVCTTAGTLKHQGKLTSGPAYTVRAGSYGILKRLY